MSPEARELLQPRSTRPIFLRRRLALPLWPLAAVALVFAWWWFK